VSDFLTVQEFAEILRVHRNTVQRLAETGQLPGSIAIRVKKRTTWRIPRSALEGLANQESRPTLQPLLKDDSCENPRLSFPILSKYLPDEMLAQLPPHSQDVRHVARDARKPR
jgi:excisionase family DNA binding protein